MAMRHRGECVCERGGVCVRVSACSPRPSSAACGACLCVDAILRAIGSVSRVAQKSRDDAPCQSSIVVSAPVRRSDRVIVYNESGRDDGQIAT